MEQKLTHWKKLINPDYIGAYSLDNGKDLIVKIEKVTREVVTGVGGKKEECTIVYLKGQKPLILNRTNAKMITKLAGTPYIEKWSGLSITLYVSTTKMAGEIVECLRIRDEKPKLPELIPGTENWTKSLAGIKNGYTIDQIKSKYSISKANETKLIQEAK